MVCLYGQTYPSDSLQRRMLDDERLFLSRMPTDLQHRQMLAVRAAISTPIRDKIAISCMLREIHEFSSHAIRHGLYIKNRKRLFCP